MRTERSPERSRWRATGPSAGSSTCPGPGRTRSTPRLAPSGSGTRSAAVGSSSTSPRTRSISSWPSAATPRSISVPASSVAASRVGNVACPDRPSMQDVGSLTLVARGAVGEHRVDLLSPAGLPTWGDVRLTVVGTEGTLEVRANIDVAGEPGGEHLIVTDADGVASRSTYRMIRCRGPTTFWPIWPTTASDCAARPTSWRPATWRSRPRSAPSRGGWRERSRRCGCRCRAPGRSGRHGHRPAAPPVLARCPGGDRGGDRRVRRRTPRSSRAELEPACGRHAGRAPRARGRCGRPVHSAGGA